MTTTLEVRDGVTGVAAGGWDALAGGGPPVLHHDVLSALERADCVGAPTGWLPKTIVAIDAATEGLLGGAPAYIKLHSMGEFVYDWAWADASHRAGLRYYPKMVIAAPFSPVSGPRLLTAPGLDSEASEQVARALLLHAEETAKEEGCTGLHMLFCTREEARLAEGMGYIIRSGVQFHWHNQGYRDFQDFLDRFRSKRRNQIRRERRRVVEAGIETVSLTGDAIERRHMDHAFRFYAATVDRFSWGRRYLNEAFFDALWQSQRDAIQLTLAQDTKTGEIVAGTFNFQKGLGRYGRYWGCDAEIPMLHFEVCSYAAIEDCIAKGLQVFEAGAGGGHHKFSRGFLPVETFSAHKLFHPGFHDTVARFCAQEATSIRAEIAGLRDELFVR
jgi:predicted N-acyltransferase